MTSSALATRYASALADVVTSPSSRLPADRAVQELRGFQNALSASEELRTVLASPAVAPARKRAVVGRLADMLGLSQISRNFLYILIDKRRAAALPVILDSFESLLDERLGFSRAEITSAAELTEAQRASLTARLTQLTGRQVRLKFSIDPQLIGGVVARVGSTVYDGSVKGQLEALSKRLAAE